jgi:hypothetical protein
VAQAITYKGVRSLVGSCWTHTTTNTNRITKHTTILTLAAMRHTFIAASDSIATSFVFHHKPQNHHTIPRRRTTHTHTLRYRLASVRNAVVVRALFQTWSRAGNRV